MNWIFLIIFISSTSGELVQEKKNTKGSSLLVTLQHHSSAAADDSCCSHCSPVTVRPELLTSKENINILGTELAFSDRLDPHGWLYEGTDGEEAVITYSQTTGNMFGSFTDAEGKSYSIERCHAGHVIKMNDENVTSSVTAFRNDWRRDQYENRENITSGYDYSAQSLSAGGRHQDNNEIVEYSIMFYYTKELERMKPDMEGMIDHLITQLNKAYKKSEIPIRAKKFCSERATFRDRGDMFKNFRSFQKMKGNRKALRNTADAAVLLITQRGGGVASFRGRESVSGCGGDLKLCYDVFRHEMGHNFGADDPPRRPNSRNRIGHGYCLPKKLNGRKQCTIMGGNVLNYYSNPRVKHPQLGLPLGVEGKYDVARLITQNRRKFARTGDESGKCNRRP